MVVDSLIHKQEGAVVNRGSNESFELVSFVDNLIMHDEYLAERLNFIPLGPIVNNS